MVRVVEPEILDELGWEDARAVRSRRDLRLINGLMRGEDWILGCLRGWVEAGLVDRVVELGAGEGCLARRMAAAFADVEVVAVDLRERVVEGVNWVAGDVMELEQFGVAVDGRTVVVANLFLHHFEADGLARLGRSVAGCGALLAAEPHRVRRALWMGRGLFPLINGVTRHDMMVSIRAGFVAGELEGLLGLEGRGFESVTAVGMLGGLRFRALKEDFLVSDR